MRLSLGVIAALLLMLAAVPVFALEPVSKTIGQADAPLQIIKYSARYDSGSGRVREGIRHEVRYKNVSDQPIVALQIGLVSFGVWNNFLDRTGGVSIRTLDPGKEADGTWVVSASSGFTFLTGAAYVSRVRFEDGRIWEADLNEIATALDEIERGFDPERLADE